MSSRFSLLAITSLLLACGGTPAPEALRLDDRDISQVEACEELLFTLRNTSVDTRSHDTLDTILDEADALLPLCREAYPRVASNRAERHFNVHRAEQIALQALFLEAELADARRDHALYCDVLGHAFRLLLQGVARLDEALLDDGVSPDERTRLRELRGLDLQAIDVLFLTYEGRCGDPSSP
ncbi:MAG: hypothetical protein EA398_12230 [Deltaproteobacteria bacterium]|nr:MAG: hypothetical protein EA398_12230 [Deltaproteobacteria bacterium]